MSYRIVCVSLPSTFHRSLGKTLECIGLISVHPHSPQPFPLTNPSTGAPYPNGTAALDAAIAACTDRDLLSGLFACAAIPADAKDAYELPTFAPRDKDIGHTVADRRDRKSLSDKVLCRQFAAYGEFVPKWSPGREGWTRAQVAARVLRGEGLIESRATVVLVPASLTHQWEAEVLKWAPQLSVYIYPGLGENPFYDRYRDDTLRMVRKPEVDNSDPRFHGWVRTYLERRAKMITADLVIVSFSTLEEDAKRALTWTSDDNVLPLHQFQFHRVIIDESQMVNIAGGGGRGAGKSGNWGSSAEVRRRLEMALDIKAINRWCCSGTPLSNPEEVGSVLEFLQHQPFASGHWWKKALLPALQVALTRQQERAAVASALNATDGMSDDTAHRITLARRLSLREQDVLGLTSLDAESLASLFEARRQGSADVTSLVKRFGDGLRLLYNLLRPILWRNTRAHLAATGDMSLPPQHELRLSLRLGPEEERAYRDVVRHMQQNVLGPLRAAVREMEEGGSSSGAGAGAGSSSSSSASGGLLSLPSNVLSRSAQLQLVLNNARDSLLHLREACVASNLMSRQALARAGIAAAAGGESVGTSISDLMNRFVDSAQAEVLVAQRKLTLPSLRAGQSAEQEKKWDAALQHYETALKACGDAIASGFPTLVGPLAALTGGAAASSSSAASDASSIAELSSALTSLKRDQMTSFTRWKGLEAAALAGAMRASQGLKQASLAAEYMARLEHSVLRPLLGCQLRPALARSLADVIKGALRLTAAGYVSATLPALPMDETCRQVLRDVSVRAGKLLAGGVTKLLVDGCGDSSAASGSKGKASSSSASSSSSSSSSSNSNSGAVAPPRIDEAKIVALEDAYVAGKSSSSAALHSQLMGLAAYSDADVSAVVDLEEDEVGGKPSDAVAASSSSAAAASSGAGAGSSSAVASIPDDGLLLSKPFLQRLRAAVSRAEKAVELLPRIARWKEAEARADAIDRLLKYVRRSEKRPEMRAQPAAAAVPAKGGARSASASGGAADLPASTLAQQAKSGASAAGAAGAGKQKGPSPVRRNQRRPSTVGAGAKKGKKPAADDDDDDDIIEVEPLDSEGDAAAEADGEAALVDDEVVVSEGDEDDEEYSGGEDDEEDGKGGSDGSDSDVSAGSQGKRKKAKKGKKGGKKKQPVVKSPEEQADERFNWWALRIRRVALMRELRYFAAKRAEAAQKAPSSSGSSSSAPAAATPVVIESVGTGSRLVPLPELDPEVVVNLQTSFVRKPGVDWARSELGKIAKLPQSTQLARMVMLNGFTARALVDIAKRRRMLALGGAGGAGAGLPRPLPALLPAIPRHSNSTAAAAAASAGPVAGTGRASSSSSSASSLAASIAAGNAAKAAGRSSSSSSSSSTAASGAAGLSAAGGSIAAIARSLRPAPGANPLVCTVHVTPFEDASALLTSALLQAWATGEHRPRMLLRGPTGAVLTDDVTGKPKSRYVAGARVTPDYPFGFGWLADQASGRRTRAYGDIIEHFGCGVMAPFSVGDNEASEAVHAARWLFTLTGCLDMRLWTAGLAHSVLPLARQGHAELARALALVMSVRSALRAERDLLEARRRLADKQQVGSLLKGKSGSGGGKDKAGGGGGVSDDDNRDDDVALVAGSAGGRATAAYAAAAAAAKAAVAAAESKLKFTQTHAKIAARHMKAREQEGRKKVGEAGAGAGAGSSSSSSAAAAAASSSEEGGDADEEGFQCSICCEPCSSDFSLTPCCHVFCSSCLLDWTLKSNGLNVPAHPEAASSSSSGAGAGSSSSSSAIAPAEASLYERAKSQPSMSADCPDCRKRFELRSLFTVDASSSGMELSLTSLSSSSSAAAASGGAAVDAQLPSTSDVNKFSLGEAVLRSGTKVAALVRRLKALPPTDKVVVATAWPKLLEPLAAALAAEGIKAEILAGSPAQRSRVVRTFSMSSPSECKVLLLHTSADCAGLTL